MLDATTEQTEQRTIAQIRFLSTGQSSDVHRARLGILKLSTGDCERARPGCTSLSPKENTALNEPLLANHKRSTRMAIAALGLGLVLAQQVIEHIVKLQVPKLARDAQFSNQVPLWRL